MTDPSQPKPAARMRKIAILVALACLAPVAAALATPAPALVPSEVDPDLAASWTPGVPIDAFLTYDHEPAAADGALLEGLGLQVLRTYSFDVVYVVGTPESLLAAARLPGVVWVQGNDALQYYSNTATVATRAREAWDAKSTSTSPVVVGGSVVDGSGVTVAIVDSGVDGTHPDLAGAMVANVKHICTTPGLSNAASGYCYGNQVLFGHPCSALNANLWVSLPDTDSSSGHGTHVAGIVAGRGVASNGRIMGQAPGAGIVGISVGEGISVLTAVDAFQWIICHPALGVDIVSNSWGTTGAYVATDPVNMGADALVLNGMTVLFAAGNDGSAATNQVNPYAKNPTPGVIGVGSTYDNDEARRATATVSTYSSTCRASDAAVDCPDVGAPGELISSAQAKGGPVVLALGAGGELNYLPYYSSISGTSMATPAVAGVLALVEQAAGGIAPAASETLLKNTAVAVTGITYPVPHAPCTATGGKNVAIGCGHVDAIAALESVLATAPLGSPLPQLSQNPHVYVGVAGAGADGQFVSGTQWSVPAGQSVQLSERTLAGETAIAVGQACRFVVFPVSPAGPSTTVPCTGAGAGLTADTTGLRMDAPYAFASGVYRVEPQIQFGTTWRAFDHFQVRTIGSGSGLGGLCVTDFVAAESADFGTYVTQLGTLDVLNYDSYTVTFVLDTLGNVVELVICTLT